MSESEEDLSVENPPVENVEIDKSLEDLENEMDTELGEIPFAREESPQIKRSVIDILFKHQFIRFVFSSVLGSIIFYILYELVHSILSYSNFQFLIMYKASIAFFVCYIISIWFQHALHQVIVFYEEKISYLKSLFWTYAAYSVSIVVTPVMIAILTSVGIHHRVSWLIGLIVTGIFNYFSMKVSFWCSQKIEERYQRISQDEEQEEFINDHLELEDGLEEDFKTSDFSEKRE